MITAFDISTKKLSWVKLNAVGRMTDANEIESKQKTLDGRLRDFIWHLPGVIIQKQDHVFIEDLPYVKNRRGAISLGQALGALKAYCFIMQAHVTVVRGSDWKKQIGLSGNANKAAIAEYFVSGKVDYMMDDWLRDRVMGSQDLMDATGVAIYGWLNGS